MSFGPLAGFFVKSLDVSLELGLVHAPDTAPADLDRRQLARADQGICLRDAHCQIGGDVFKGVEARRDGRTRFFVRRLAHEAQSSTAKPQLPVFGSVCSRLPDTNRDWWWKS